MATRAFRATLAVSLLALAAGCAYSFRGTLPDSIRSVQVRQFRSSVTEYGLNRR